MPKVEKIKITRNTIAGGKPVQAGDVLTVGEDISDRDALFLTQIKKAVVCSAPAKPAPESDTSPDADPAKMNAPEVENREKDLDKKIAKRDRKSKKKKK